MLKICEIEKFGVPHAWNSARAGMHQTLMCIFVCTPYTSFFAPNNSAPRVMKMCLIFFSRFKRF